MSTPVGSPVEHEAERAFGVHMKKGTGSALGSGSGSGSDDADADANGARERERGRPRLVRRADARVPSVLEEDEEGEAESESEDGEAEADEDDDDDICQPSLETVMAALKAFRSGMNPILGTGDEQRDPEL